MGNSAQSRNASEQRAPLENESLQDESPPSVLDCPLRTCARMPCSRYIDGACVSSNPTSASAHPPPLAPRKCLLYVRVCRQRPHRLPAGALLTQCLGDSAFCLDPAMRESERGRCTAVCETACAYCQHSAKRHAFCHPFCHSFWAGNVASVATTSNESNACVVTPAGELRAGCTAVCHHELPPSFLL